MANAEEVLVPSSQSDHTKETMPINSVSFSKLSHNVVTNRPSHNFAV